MATFVKPQAQLIIARPDKTEDRFIRPRPVNRPEHRNSGPANVDEEYRLVMECPPYTASFNHLLKENRPKENTHRLVSLVCNRMHSENIPMSTTTYNLLMKRVVRYTDGLIFSLYEELKAEGTKPSASVRPNAETFRLLFRACERGAEYSRAFRLYQQMRDLFHLLPDTPVYNSLLGYCAACRDAAQATYFVSEMKENQVPLDVNTYNCLMSVLVDTAPCSETIKIFTELTNNNIQPTVRTFNIVLKAAQISDDYDRVFQLFEEMKKKGLLPDVTTYNILLWTCQQRVDYILGRGKYSHVLRTREQKLRGRASLGDLVLLLHQEMQAIGVQPNTFTYNKLLSVLVDCENRQIFSIYQQVLEKYVYFQKKKPPNRSVQMMDDHSLPEPLIHQAVEDALVSDDPREDGRICAVGVFPNRRTYYLMMQACYRLEPKEKCRFLYDHMIRNDITPNKEIMLLLFRVCESLNDQKWGKKLLEGANKYHLSIDTDLYNRFLAVLALSDDDQLEKEFELMRMGINVFGAKADIESYNILLSRYCLRKKADEGIALFHRILEGHENVEANSETFCVMLDLFSSKNDYLKPMSIVEQYVKNIDAPPLGKKFYYELLRYFAIHDAQLAESLFLDIKMNTPNKYLPLRYGITVDTEFYSIIMSFYSKQKKFDRLRETFSELKSSSTLDIDSGIYKAMFEMYDEFDDIQSVIKLFDEARMNRVLFNLDTYNVVFSSCIKANNVFVYDVFKDLCDSEIPPHESTLALFMPTTEGRAMLNEAIELGLFYKVPAFTQF